MISAQDIAAVTANTINNGLTPNLLEWSRLESTVPDGIVLISRNRVWDGVFSRRMNDGEFGIDGPRNLAPIRLECSREWA